jgi:hypothetical protein
MSTKLWFGLLFLFALQSYGIYGAAQVQGLTRVCTLEVGPLCYLWEATTLGKLVGAKDSDEVDELAEAARRAFESQISERLSEAAEEGQESVKRFIDEGHDALLQRIKKLSDKP